MAMRMKISDPQEAKKYFEAKMTFTTGPAELKYMLEKETRPNIIDVREARDYVQGHIPGAINLPRDQWNTLKGLAKDKLNVLYCYTMVCHLAPQAALFFANQGFPVMEMEGGFEAWEEYEYETEKGTEEKKTA